MCDNFYGNFGDRAEFATWTCGSRGGSGIGQGAVPIVCRSVTNRPWKETLDVNGGGVWAITPHPYSVFAVPGTGTARGAARSNSVR